VAEGFSTDSVGFFKLVDELCVERRTGSTVRVVSTCRENGGWVQIPQALTWLE
jgi:hypothetical protein